MFSNQYINISLLNSPQTIEFMEQIFDLYLLNHTNSWVANNTNNVVKGSQVYITCTAGRVALETGIQGNILPQIIPFQLLCSCHPTSPWVMAAEAIMLEVLTKNKLINTRFNSIQFLTKANNNENEKKSYNCVSEWMSRFQDPLLWMMHHQRFGKLIISCSKYCISFYSKQSPRPFEGVGLKVRLSEPLGGPLLHNPRPSPDW